MEFGQGYFKFIMHSSIHSSFSLRANARPDAAWKCYKVITFVVFLMAY